VAEQCGFNGGSKDVASMVQLKLRQSSSGTADLTQPFLAPPGRLMEAKPVICMNVWTKNCNQIFDDENHSKKNKKLHDLQLFVIFIMESSLCLHYTLMSLVKYKMYSGRKEVADSSRLVRLLTPHFHDLCGERRGASKGLCMFVRFVEFVV
jgi:hypothetical protein